MRFTAIGLMAWIFGDVLVVGAGIALLLGTMWAKRAGAGLLATAGGAHLLAFWYLTKGAMPPLKQSAKNKLILFKATKVESRNSQIT